MTGRWIGYTFSLRSDEKAQKEKADKMRSLSTSQRSRPLGRRGCTIVRLRDAKALTVRPALIVAWCDNASKRLARQFENLNG